MCFINEHRHVALSLAKVLKFLNTRKRFELMKSSVYIDRATGDYITLHQPKDLNTAHDYQLRKHTKTTGNNLSLFSPRIDMRSIYVEKSANDVTYLPESMYVRVPFFDKDALDASVKTCLVNRFNSMEQVEFVPSSLTLTEALNNTYRWLNKYVQIVEDSKEDLSTRYDEKMTHVLFYDMDADRKYAMRTEPEIRVLNGDDPKDFKDVPANTGETAAALRKMFCSTTVDGKTTHYINPASVRILYPEVCLLDPETERLYIDKDSFYNRVIVSLLDRIQALEK